MQQSDGALDALMGALAGLDTLAIFDDPGRLIAAAGPIQRDRWPRNPATTM